MRCRSEIIKFDNLVNSCYRDSSFRIGAGRKRIGALPIFLISVRRTRRSRAVMGEYLTSSEAAEMLRIKAKTLNNMKARGLFAEGVHFFRRPGLGPRWKRDALVQWLEGEARATEAFPLSQPGGRRLAG